MSGEEIPPGFDAHCKFCGGKLEIELGVGTGKPNSARTTCTVCGREDGFGWATFSARRKPSGWRDRLAGLTRPFKRPGPPLPSYISADGSVDLRKMVNLHSFSVHGLGERVAGLRLKGVGFGGHGSRSETRATLTYYVGHPRIPDAALEISQTNAERYRHVDAEHFETARTAAEHELVAGLVRNNSSEEQTRRWYHEGTFSSLWNMDTAAKAARETLYIEIVGENRAVEIASWREPFDVSVSTFSIPPVNLSVSTLNLSRQDTVNSLQALVALTGNDKALDAHQADSDETRKLMWPATGGHAETGSADRHDG